MVVMGCVSVWLSGKLEMGTIGRKIYGPLADVQAQQVSESALTYRWVGWSHQLVLSITEFTMRSSTKAVAISELCKDENRHRIARSNCTSTPFTTFNPTRQISYIQAAALSECYVGSDEALHGAATCVVAQKRRRQ